MSPHFVFGLSRLSDSAFTHKLAYRPILHYYFFDQPTDGEQVLFTDGSTKFVPWTTKVAEMDVVRQAFSIWKNLGIGLEFKEVADRNEAEVRIGFMRGDGAWSYIGRDILDHGPTERTMNFGWDLTRSAREIDTAIHEIGHTLGFPHEHQNPNAGIVWNEEAVYAKLAGPPNFWSREKTQWNIIRKIRADEVQGSSWDPDSVMHYPFEAGLIEAPAEYKTGLTPVGGLSLRDKTWVRKFYPLLTADDYIPLQSGKSVPLTLQPTQQMNFTFVPNATRKYQFQTFGTADTVMVLFEDVNGAYRYVMGDDDSGEDRNAHIEWKLFKDRKYVIRVRMYYAEKSGDTAIMVW